MDRWFPQAEAANSNGARLIESFLNLANEYWKPVAEDTR